ncbi:Fic family protein [Saccharothrix tamanrassetensis]|uniref:Fic family protein n=1 Tax=Saccharothrix tamanrassetensis TaxID=1051531 RepID=A0A841CGE4_9PSEU|nr:Fic/DOC family N-terminal domain-containing protein [Saccharothrix tamanrassetensis]MBB5956421.1 Fic family protein [Saccharothrix tamanrassetensis]
MNVPPLPSGQWAPVRELPGIPETRLREGAYLPPPLPSDLPLPVATYRLVAEAEHALGRLDEAAERLRVRSGLVRATQVRDAQSSAGLSGTPVGLREALAADLLASRGDPPSDRSAPEQLLAPYLSAYDHGIERVRHGSAVDAELLGELTAIMTGRPGLGLRDLLRREPGWLGITPERAYLLTATGAHLVAQLEQWSTWVREEAEQPRIAKIALAHYQLEVLQPFPAANGHVARGFSMLEMVHCGLLRDQILPLSVWLDDTLPEYQEEIRAVVDTGRIHHWVEFFAAAVRDQALAQLRLIGHLENLAEEYARLLPRTGNLPEVAASLIGFPVVDHRALCERYAVTVKAATDLTRRLVERRILVPWDFRDYRRVFVCRDVLRLLADHPDTTALP